MAAKRLPASVTASLVLHGGAFGLWIFLAGLSPKKAQHMISGVGLIVHVKQPKPAAGAPAVKAPPPAPSLKDFFKLALPAMPKLSAPLELKVKLPEHQLSLKTAAKLEERKRAEAPAVKALDLDKDRAEAPALAQMNLPEVSTRRVKAMAALPVLQEVGRRQVANLPAAIKLEEERQQAARAMAIEKMVVPTHVHVNPAASPMRLAAEAQPGSGAEPSRFKKALEGVLPSERVVERPQEMRAPTRDLFKETTIAPPAKRAAASAMTDEPKKSGVEIEGALKNRQVFSSDIPAYPDWLKKLGTAEAAVRLDFCVSPAGDVIGGSIRPDLSSGYGKLDRLCADSLRNWKFAPLGALENQCGKITFNFELE